MFNLFKPTPKKFVEQKIKSSLDTTIKNFIRKYNISDDIISAQKLFMLYCNVKDSYRKSSHLYMLVLKKYPQDKFSYTDYMSIVRNTIDRIFSKYIDVPKQEDYDW